MEQTRRALGDFRASGLRWGQLLALLGLSGMAISQPLLSIAGENPSLFTFADIGGWQVAAVVLIVALAPPMLLWVLVTAVGRFHRRAGDVAFVTVAAVLAGLAAVQWVKAAGVEARWAVAIGAAAVAVGFAAALVRLPLAATFTRYTAVLPVISLLLFGLSPAGDLLSGERHVAEAGADVGAGPGAGDGADTGQDLAPVVFIMMDEFPTLSILDADRNVDDVRFPNLAAFGEDATWYRDYTTQATKTLLAVPAILTGHTPTEEFSGLWTEHPDNLFDVLAPTHDLEASEVLTKLCGYSGCEVESGGTGAGLSGALGEIGDVWGQRVSLDPIAEPDLGQFREEAVPVASGPRGVDGDLRHRGDVARRLDRVTAFTDSLAQASGPSLSYLHLMLPHWPWTLYPDGTPYVGPEKFTGEDPSVPDASDWQATKWQQQHLLQATYADRVVGEILDLLRATGRYDESLVVITADHGVTLRDLPNRRQPNANSIEELAYVPLFVKAPGQSDGSIDDTNLMAPDLLPTIADILGVDLPAPVDGLAAGDPRIAERGERKEIYDFGSEYQPDFQGVITFDRGKRPKVEDRFVGPIGPDDPLLGGLFAPLGVDAYRGAQVRDLDITGGPKVEVAGLDHVETSSTDDVLGSIEGRIDGATRGTVLVAIDGRVESAAPVEDAGAFTALLPPLDGAGTRGPMELILLADGELARLDAVGWAR